MHDAAERTGWKLSPADPGFIEVYSVVTLTGEEAGLTVRLERAGAANVFATSAFFRPTLPLSFMIQHQGLGGTIANFVGFHDIEIGDPDFDSSFRLISKDPAWLTRLLTPEAKQALVKLSEGTKSFGSDFQVSEWGVRVVRNYAGPMSIAEVLCDIPLATSVALVLQAAAISASR